MSSPRHTIKPGSVLLHLPPDRRMCLKLSSKHVENGNDSSPTAFDVNVVKKREEPAG